MAFDIILYQNMSEKNKLDKDIQFPLTITGTLKNDCSISAFSFSVADIFTR